jgi:hypothetical protein
MDNGEIVLAPAMRSEARNCSHPQWDIENTPIVSQHMMAVCMRHIHALLCSLSSASVARGACAYAHRSFHRVWLCVQKNAISRLVNRSPLSSA